MMAISGPGNFENDDAISMIMELEYSNSVKVVYQSVDYIFKRSNSSEYSYIDVDAAAYAIAAGEVIALFSGKPGTDLPERLVEWSKDKQFTFEPEFISRCIQAIEIVYQKSEYRDLMSSGGEQFTIWQDNVHELLERLKDIIQQR